ncbi:MAG: N-acyl-D-amino-acid deacylase family protein [Bacillota bacterium]
MLDLLIHDATVVDGTGKPAFRANVGIAQGRIALIAHVPSSQSVVARRVIDGPGLYLAPGFIDIHNHSDLTLVLNPNAESMLAQGVTTLVVGNCGFSVAPWPGADAGWKADQLREDIAFLKVDLRDHFQPTWKSFGEYLEQLQRRSPAVNVIALVGHGTIRQQVLGRVARPPSREELNQMKRLLQASLDEGAAGLSSGLIYYPSCYARTDELVELASVVASAGKIYTTHIRGEGETLFSAIAEAIEIARRAQVSTQISHVKAESRLMWGRLPEVLSMVDSARQEGLDVDCDQYPYTAYYTTLGSFLPPDLMQGDWQGALRCLRKRQDLRKVVEEGTSDWSSPIKGMEWDDFVVDGSGNPQVDGKTIQRLSELWGMDPFDALCQLLLECGPQLMVVGHAMCEKDVEACVAREDVMVGSDGFALPFHGTVKPHPRCFGTFPRVIARYARERKLLTLEAAVYKMTGAPAKKLGLKDRGFVQEGYWADLVLFDWKTIEDRASFQEPRVPPIGIQYVLVNGHVAYPTQSSSGRWGKVLT